MATEDSACGANVGLFLEGVGFRMTALATYYVLCSDSHERLKEIHIRDRYAEARSRLWTYEGFENGTVWGG